MKQRVEKKNKRWIRVGAVCLFLILLCVCTGNQEKSGDGNNTFFCADDYVYEGAKLTEQQIEAMDDDMVEMVQQIICAVDQSKTEIDLSSFSTNEQWIKMSVQVAAGIDPMVEECDISIDSAKKGQLTIDYGCGVEEHKEKVRQFHQKIEEIVKSCAADADSDSDVAYAKAVFDYLTEHCQYDYDTFSSSRESGITKKEGAERYRKMTVYRTIMEGPGVCQQFSKAYSLLLRQAGILTLEIGGISNIPFASNSAVFDGRTEGELFGISHMWNVVQLSGAWYGVDVTGAVNALEDAGTSNENPDNYFGMDDGMMQEHFPSDTVISTIGYQQEAVPKCEKMLENDSIVSRTEGNQTQQSQKNEEPVGYQIVSKSISDNRGTIELKFDDDTDIVYEIQVSLPSSDVKQGMSLYYVIGDTNPAIEENTAVVKVKTNLDDNDKADLFLDGFVNTVIEVVEQEYQLDTAQRILYGEGTAANLCMFALFQNDVVTKDVFSEYVCVDPDMQNRCCGKSIGEWEQLYFERCRQLPVSLSIQCVQQSDAGQMARLQLLIQRIKYREYKNFSLN